MPRARNPGCRSICWPRGCPGGAPDWFASNRGQSPILPPWLPHWKQWLREGKDLYLFVPHRRQCPGPELARQISRLLGQEMAPGREKTIAPARVLPFERPLPALLRPQKAAFCGPTGVGVKTNARLSSTLAPQVRSGPGCMAMRCPPQPGTLRARTMARCEQGAARRIPEQATPFVNR